MNDRQKSSEEIIETLKKNSEDIKALAQKVLKLREDAAEERAKRKTMDQTISEDIVEVKELAATMVKLHEDVKIAVFGCEKLHIHGLVHDNQHNKAFIKKLIWVWSGMTMAGAAYIFFLNTGTI